ncbi:MAG TPA: hypothetical protein VF805_14600 [Anaeromyxobacteraceae bacterium]
MTKRLLAVALPLALAACGGSDSPTVFTISTGTYAVSGATSVQATDTCGLLPVYQASGKVIGINVSGTTATFDLANNNPPANTLPTATISGNTLGAGTEANYTVAVGTTCVVRIHKSVTGDITSNDHTALLLTFSAATDSGTCNPADLGFANLPCNSSYHFLANKQ